MKSRTHSLIIALLFLITTFGSFFSIFSIGYAASCAYDANKSIIASIDDCLEGDSTTKRLTDTEDTTDASLTGKGRERIKEFVNRLTAFGMLIAVGGLVIGGGYMASSVGNETKVKKGKDAVKWSIIGVIVLAIGYPALNALINFVYQLGGA